MESSQTYLQRTKSAGLAMVMVKNMGMGTHPIIKLHTGVRIAMCPLPVKILILLLHQSLTSSSTTGTAQTSLPQMSVHVTIAITRMK